jgi:putative AdoMet-dependent methyltransferase
MDFSPELFDDWAASYDEETSQEKGFPFEGYRQLLSRIVEECDPQPGQIVLDLGCGTGKLGSLFLQRGCQVYGVDFSAGMIAQAAALYPSIRFATQDIRRPIPQDFPARFDFIVSAYTFHHFPINEKLKLIHALLKAHAGQEGRLLIGDLVFSDLQDRIKAAGQYAEAWDEEEFWVLEQDIVPILKSGLNFSVERISFCASILEFGLAAGLADEANPPETQV